MCGIIGGVNTNLTVEDILSLQHRGPDQQDRITREIAGQQVVLGHTRLSIVDLSEAGSQPMVSDCGNYILIYNGEMYNHEELRAEIKGVTFRGTSDTETLLYYLIQKGMDGLKDLNGIFAFCFLDLKKAELYLVRDPFGIKPLYYSATNSKIAFSSEIRGIDKMMGQSGLNYGHIYTFLRLRYNPSPQTFFKNVKKLVPGHYLKVELEGMWIKEPQFYSFKPGEKLDLSQEEALERYDYYLRRAIKRQLMADVPISILLSGGVDSALLTKIATEVSNQTFKSYTAGYLEKTDIDEIDEAIESATILKVPHEKVLIDEQAFWDNLTNLINIIEEPLGSQSIFPIFYLSQQIHQDGFKVTLSGQGVDEPWAGYPKYNSQSIIHGLSKVLGGASFLQGTVKHDQYKRALNAITAKDRIQRFVEIGSVFDEREMKQLIRSEEVIKKGERSIRELYEHRFGLFAYDQFQQTDAMTYFDLRMNLADDLLLYTDKISMHHSVEIRVPYLDLELVKFVESLPAKYKVNLGANKILHKQLAEKYLPSEIIYRKKKHFGTPLNIWFKGKMGDYFENQLTSSINELTMIFDHKKIHQLFKTHREGKVNHEKQIFLLICLHAWAERHVVKV